jgi:hypothetical protein
MEVVQANWGGKKRLCYTEHVDQWSLQKAIPALF